MELQIAEQSRKLIEMNMVDTGYLVQSIVLMEYYSLAIYCLLTDRATDPRQ